MKNPKTLFYLIVLLVSSQFTSYSQSGESKVWLKGWNKVSPLYRFCNNQLQIEGLNKENGELENLSFSAKNATITKSTKEGWVDFYPLDNGNEAVLMISANGVFVDSLVFPIKEFPKPEIIIKYNGEVVNLEEGISLKGFTTGNLELEIARTDFWMFMPKDARYIFSDARITLARKSEEASQRAVNYLGKSDLFTLIAQAKSGDRLLLEVPEIIRIDSQNKAHTIAHNSIYTIPLHDMEN